MRSARRRVATLRSLCRALNGEFEGSGDPLQLVPGIRVSWEEVCEMAAEQALAPALWHAVGRPVAGAMPEHVAHDLREHYRANVVRNARFRLLLGEVVNVLNDAGVEPLVFKGALELLEEGAGRQARWMSDIDLAVPTELWERSVEALSAIGFSPEPRGGWARTSTWPRPRPARRMAPSWT